MRTGDNVNGQQNSLSSSVFLSISAGCPMTKGPGSQRGAAGRFATLHTLHVHMQSLTCRLLIAAPFCSS